MHTHAVSHLKNIGDDKEVGKHPPLCSNCKQPDDPSEPQQRNKDDSGFEKTPVHYQEYRKELGSQQCYVCTYIIKQ